VLVYKGMRLGDWLRWRFPSPKCEYPIADSLKLAVAAAWVHFWWWPLRELWGLLGPGAGSLRDWIGLFFVALWFATPLLAMLSAAFALRDLTRLARWWQVLCAVALAAAVIRSAANWTP
jgi:hypothetical protein